MLKKLFGNKGKTAYDFNKEGKNYLNRRIHYFTSKEN